jgi:hypothetical protein
VVELYLQRYTFTQIRQRMQHSYLAIANYVATFSLVVAHTEEGRAVDEIAFLMQISAALVQQYQQLYQRYDTPEYRERISEIITLIKTRGFRPSQLEAPSAEAEDAKKGGQ